VDEVAAAPAQLSSAPPPPRHSPLEAVDPRRQLVLPPEQRAKKLTHYLFRFPAKFHPPVVAKLFDRFTEEGQVVLDPFVGSGTSLIEGTLLDRSCFGVDVDPVAVAVALAKTRRYDVDEVRRMVDRLLKALKPLDRGAEEYERLATNDISRADFDATIADESLWVPAIPKLEHWFRRYVTIDLARIHREVVRRRGAAEHRQLLLLLFGSIIRNASNADPVPVSGLEVTAHMRRLEEEGRVVDPFALMRRAVKRAMTAIEEWAAALGDRDAPVVLQGDATTSIARLPAKVDAVITSPPYHNAVDYYRRHQLEMFWMGLTADQTVRLELLPRYIGRPRIRASHPLLAEPWPTEGLAAEWEREIAAVDTQRATDFRHYMLAMSRVFRRVAERTERGAPVIMVIGHSAWNGGRIPTLQLFEEIAQQWFGTDETLWYPVQNRYMSYSRRNGASIDREHVIVLRRTEAPVDGLA
jgi:hypothetical protein